MTTDTPFDGSEIAVIALAGRFPGARNVEQLWQNLIAGRDTIRHFSTQELAAAGVDPEVLDDPRYVRARGILDELETFDAPFFGYSPREAEVMDPQHRLFLHCAWEALERAGYAPESFPGLVGVFASVNLSGYLLAHLYPSPELMESVAPLQLQIGNDKDYLATRVSYKLNLRGPSLTVQTACSSSLVAVHLARQSLFAEECDLALAGGVSILVPQQRGYFYQDDGIVSPDGRCRVFDAEAAGTVFGCGIGIVVLKRLADALRDGDTVYAVVRGSALNNDGAFKAGYTAPSLEGQSEVILEALADAGVDAETIGYVEAHGTGTALGDPIEVAALTRAFRVTTPKSGFCALGSVKSNLGHLSMAAGVTGLIKAALMLRHRTLVPSVHFRQPNPAIDFAGSPFYVSTSRAPWPPGPAPRRAGVSAFGFGGTNAHVVLEEPPPTPPGDGPGRLQIVVLSAKSATALERVTERLAAHLDENPELDCADIAYTLQVGRQAFSHRRMAVCHGPEQLRAALADASRHTLSVHQERRDRPVVFLFPGQGAQHAAMGAELYREEPCFREHADRCAEILLPHLGRDLRRLLFSGEVDAQEAARQLEQTAVAQPALFLVEYALARWWMELGVRPQAMFGHSLGEYVAACLAGVFSIEDALALVVERGRLMQSMPAGAMLAVPLGEEELAPQLSSGLSLAAVNAPARTVVSGPPEEIGELAQRLRRQGVKGRRLHTSHAYHSQMMEPIVAPFAAAGARVERRAPEIAFIANPSGEMITAAAACDPEYWARQLRQPVRFARGIAELGKEPGQILLEVGPGHTLSNLARAQVGPDTVVLPSLPRPRDGERGELAALYHAAGRLWLAGAAVDWAPFHRDRRRRRVVLPTYPFAQRRYWIEPPAASGPRPERLPTAAELADWFATPVWRQTPPLPPPRFERGGRWLVFTDSNGRAAALIDALRAAGQEVLTVTADSEFEDRGGGHFAIEAANADHYQALADALRRQGGVPERVVHLWTVEDPPAEGICWQAGFERAQTLGFYSLLWLVRTLASEVKGLWITVVSSGIQAVTGEEELIPARATVLGPCRVVPQEHPGVTCRCIDVTPASGDRVLAGRLLAELAGAHGDPVVAYRGGRRWVQGFAPVRLEGRDGMPPRLRGGGVYLVVGGTSGPGGVLTQNLRRALKEADAQLLSLPAELSDPEAVHRVLSRAQESGGAIRGVFYAPEIAAEESLATVNAITRAACEQLFATRAQSLARLEQLLEGREVGFCLVHSSLAAVLGGPGLVAHAAVHLFLDALVQRHNLTSPVPWVTINWDAWQIGDDDDGRIAPAAGAEAFLRVLAAEELTQVMVSTSDVEARLERWVRSVTEPRIPSGHSRPELGTPYVAPSNDPERRVAAICQEFLGIDRVGLDDDFFELGGDSLLATQVVARVQEVFAVTLSLRSLFDSPTVAGMTAAISREQAERAGRGAVAELLAEIGGLSDEQVTESLTSERQCGGKAGHERPERP